MTADTIGDERSIQGRSVQFELRWYVSAMLVALGVLIAVAIAISAGAQPVETLTYSGVNLTVGNASTSGVDVVNIESANFAQATSRFESAIVTNAADPVQIPLTSVVGLTTFGVENADIWVTDPGGENIITIRGELSEAVAVYAAGDDVLIILRWLEPTNPDIAVSFKSQSQLLGDAFGLDTAGFPGSIPIPELSVTVGRAASQPNLTNHISRPDVLPPAATAYFEEIYGDLPQNNIGPLENLDGTITDMFMTASIPAADLGETAADTFGFSDDTTLVLEGFLGVQLFDLDATTGKNNFDPTVASWALQLILPQQDLPDSFPEFLGDANAGWALKLSYDADDGLTKITATLDMSTTINGGSQTIEVEAFFAGGTNSVVPEAEAPECPAPQITPEDSDGDGVSDTAEGVAGTSATDEDSDDDGRCDKQEATDGTDPLDADSDDDGINDGAEAGLGTNPLDTDTDGDGLTDDREGGTAVQDPAPAGIFKTNPLDSDTDNDGILDGDDDSNGNSIPDANENTVKNFDIAVGIRAQLVGPVTFADATWLEIDNLKFEGQFKRALNAQGVVQNNYKGEIKAEASVDGFTFAVRLRGDFTSTNKKYDVRLQVKDTIPISSLLTTIGVPLPSPDILAVDFTDVFINFAVDGAKKQFYATGTLNLTIEGTTYPVFGLFGIDNAGKSIAGIRPGGDIVLSDLLPASIQQPVKDTADFQLSAADGSAGFGLVYAADPIVVNSIDIQPGVRDFFKPLLGFSDASVATFDLDLPAGISLMASLPLPDTISDTVSKLGLSPRATMRATIPFGTTQQTASVSLSTRVQNDLLPEMIQSIELKIEAEANTTDFALTLAGTVRFRFRAGMDADIANTLNGLGIPVTPDIEVGQGFDCANGSTSQPSDLSEEDPTDFYCFDVLDASIAGTVSVTAVPPSSSLKITASLTTPVSGTVWNPFGLEWIGVDSAAFLIEVEADALGTNINFGLQFDLDIAGKDLLVAANIGLRVTQVFPFAVPEFKGFRVASGAGVEIADFFDIANKIAEVSANVNGTPVPDPLDPADLGIPNIALRNLEFSLSPEGVTDLCIPQGLVIRADLYVNPTNAAPVNNPGCDGASGLPTIVDADKCQNNFANGCLFQGSLIISNQGFQANFALTEIKAGPVTLGPLVVDIAITATDQHFLLSGKGKIETIGANPTDIVTGELTISLSPTEIDIFGKVVILDSLQALVDLKADVGIFKGDLPNLELHLLLADTSTDELNGDTFASTVGGEADPVLQVIRTTAQVAGDLLAQLEATGSPVDVLAALPGALEAAGIDVPQWLKDFNTFAVDILKPIDDVVDDGFDVVMNGTEFTIPGIPGFRAFGSCVIVSQGGKCWTTPPVKIEVDGICDTVFPANTFPGLRDGNGDCTRGRLVSAVVVPFFEEAIDFVAGTDGFDLETFLDDIATLPDDFKVLEFNCVELNLLLNSTTQTFDTAIDFVIFGQRVVFQVVFDFSDPAGSAVRLIPTFVNTLFTGGDATTCQGLNTEVFALGQNAPPPTDFEADMTLSADSVDEGSPLGVTIDMINVPADGAQLLLDYGVNGITQTVNVAANETSKTVNLVYADDFRLGTKADQYSISLRWVDDPDEPNSLLAKKQVVVRNVNPIILPSSVQVSGGGVFKEGDETVLSWSVTDVGAEASFFYSIDWGDGTVSQGTSTSTAFSVPHTYEDDNPTATPSDSVNIRITVRDDDIGEATSVAAVTVENQNPTDFVVTRVDVNGDPVSGPSKEGELVYFEFSFTDPGLADTHVLSIDWGDGSTNADIEYDPASAGRLIVPKIFDDDDPTQTPLDTVTVNFSAVDDDTGSAEADVDILIANVPPVVGTPVVTPAEPTDEGEPVVATASFTDVGIVDTHDCTVDYGDGSGPNVGIVDPDARTCTGSTHWYPDNATYTVTIEVTDDDTESHSATTTHEVLNVDPTIVSLSNSARVCGATPDGDPVNISIDFTDPGFDNPLFPSTEVFTATINWGDGTVTPATIAEVDGAPTVLTTGSASGTHTYDNGGIFPVTVTLFDDDGGSAVAETVALVTGAGVLDGQVQAVGTFGGDDIKIQKKGNSSIRVDANFLPGRLVFSKSGITSVRVLSCAGDDVIHGYSTSSIPGIFEGGDDDDRVFGDAGSDSLLGEEGDDFLQAGTGDDFIDGGPGNDQAVGGSGFDTCVNTEKESGCEA